MIDGREPRREEYLSVFERLPYNKMCLYSGATNVRDVVYMKRYEWDWYSKSLNQPYVWYKYQSWFQTHAFRVVGMLKLLNGEPDYVRKE